MGKTSIEWTNENWNPVRGCQLVSDGCSNCYAMKQARRFSGPGGAYEGLTKLGSRGPIWTGEVRLVPEALSAPLRWREPRKVFVNSMSDLFHEDVPDSYVAAVFGVMAACPQHTFQVLTKRPERMARWFETMATWPHEGAADIVRLCAEGAGVDIPRTAIDHGDGDMATFDARAWPLPNVWLGVSIESQKYADERIPHLLRVPAAVRFLSCEPLLEPVDLSERHEWLAPVDQQVNSKWQAIGAASSVPMIHWVIVGGESGPGARPFDLAWCRSLVGQCRAAGVPVFVKQLGARPEWNGHGSAWEPPPSPQMIVGDMNESGRFALRLVSTKGGDPAEWPEDLRVREWPEVRHG